MPQRPISNSQLAKVDSLLRDLDGAVRETFSEAERREHEEAERSITEARRHAERHDGLLQLGSTRSRASGPELNLDC